ncbi:MAG: GvpL/GvpF family gas vesicle protein, partial [bacterium]|nr:GvpL/GvpF family gas vesicle protein [bacterium]
YCVFQNHGRRCPRILRGVGRRSVFLVQKNGLSAAASRISDADLSPDIPRVLAYESVIESIHRRGAVIPFRYGSVFEQESQIAELLEERDRHYAELLRELDGWVEMGVRVLSKSVERGQPLSSLAGVGYLAAQREHYVQADRFRLEQERISRQIHRLLAGHFARSKTETGLLGGNRLLSLHFLVHKNSIIPFRKAFQRMSRFTAVRVLSSGPWPPYNFVS